MKKRIFIGLGVVVMVIVVLGILRGNRTKKTEVEMAEVSRKELVATVSASGTIHPQRSVDVSANTMGRVTSLAVAEGDRVKEGDFLLEIDPTEFRSVVRALEAAVRTSQADLTLAEASAEKADQDLRRAKDLHEQGLVSVEQLETTHTSARVERARVDAARSRRLQQEANLDRARYDLEKVTVSAPMSGIITRLNVEEGENAIMGTLNNPGTVLLVIADLSTMEARVKVDETEVVKVTTGQSAVVEIDAFPDSSFTGRVTDIGNSPIFTRAGSSGQAVDFEVKVTLDDRIPNIRPGLSCKAEITVAVRDSAIAVPLGAVTVRKWPPEERFDRTRRGRRRARRVEPSVDQAADQAGTSAEGVEGVDVAEDAATTSGTTTTAAKIEREDKEGVFVVEDGIAWFNPVKLGIAGEEDFELLSGLDVGQTVVTGPFRNLRDLEHGDAVKQSSKSKRGKGD